MSELKLVRYCPECGSIGEVGEGFIDCCPDGNRAVRVPEAVAKQAADGFAPSSQQPAAEGWKLVPVEPTETMIDAGFNHVYAPTNANDIEYVWQSMLAAAPSPQQQQPDEKVIAWVRFCSDGCYEGPIMDCDKRMDGARRESGAWTPLVVKRQQQAGHFADDSNMVQGDDELVSHLVEALEYYEDAELRSETCGGGYWSLEDDGEIARQALANYRARKGEQG